MQYCVVDVRGYVYAILRRESLTCYSDMLPEAFSIRSIWIIVSPCLSAVHDHYLLILHVLAQDTTYLLTPNDRCISQTILRRSKCHFIRCPSIAFTLNPNTSNPVHVQAGGVGVAPGSRGRTSLAPETHLPQQQLISRAFLRCCLIFSSQAATINKTAHH